MFISVRYLDFSKIYMHCQTVSYSNSFQCEYFNINEHVATLMNKLYKMPDVRRPNSCRKYGPTIGAWICLLCYVLIENKDMPVIHTRLHKLVNDRIRCYVFFNIFQLMY